MSPSPHIGVLHVPELTTNFDNTRDLIEINLKKDNYTPIGLHADGIVSLDLNLKMHFGNRLLSFLAHKL